MIVSTVATKSNETNVQTIFLVNKPCLQTAKFEKIANPVVNSCFGNFSPILLFFFFSSTCCNAVGVINHVCRAAGTFKILMGNYQLYKVF